MTALRTILVMALLLCAGAKAETTYSVTLAWDRSPDSTVTGYKVYYTQLSTGSVGMVNAGNVSSVGVPGLAESTTYSFYCVAYNGSGVESVPSNTIQYTTPSTTPPPADLGLAFEAEAGTITAPFYVVNGLVQQDVQTTVSGGGRASYIFTVTNAGNYTVTMLVNAPDGGANSFYVNVDAEPAETNTWDIPITTGIQERTVNWTGESGPHIFALTQTKHLLVVRGREAGTQMDRIKLVLASPIPVPPPAPPTNLRLQQLQGNRVDVSWRSDLSASTEVWRSLETDPFNRLAVVAAGVMHYTDRARAKVVRYKLRSCGPTAGCGDYSATVGYGP